MRILLLPLCASFHRKWDIVTEPYIYGSVPFQIKFIQNKQCAIKSLRSEAMQHAFSRRNGEKNEPEMSAFPTQHFMIITHVLRSKTTCVNKRYDYHYYNKTS